MKPAASKAIHDSCGCGLPEDSPDSVGIRKAGFVRASGLVALGIVALCLLPDLCMAGDYAESSRKVAGIRFEGNRSFSDRQLLKWMHLQPPRLFRRERFTTLALEEDLDNLRRFYRSEGFLLAEVEGGIDPGRRRKEGVQLLVRVREGPRWTVSELHLLATADVGGSLIDSLSAVIRLRPPAPYQVHELSADRNRIYEALAGMGYLDASVQVEVKLCHRSRLAALRYRIIPGSRARFRDVKIRGLEKTRPCVVEREIGLVPGQLLRPRDAGAIRASLLRTGLFRTVRVVPDPADWGRGDKGLLIELEESPPGAAGLGLGYGSIDRVRALVSVDQKNLRGHGIRAGLRGVVGERRRVVEGELSTPWTLGHRLVTQVSSAYEYHRPRSYEAERIRGGLAFKRPIGFFWSVNLGYQAERVVLLRTRATGYGPEAVRLGTLAAGASRDTRDDLDQPSAGGYLRVTQAWTAPWLGSQYHYGTSEVRRLRFRSVGRVTVASRAETGWIQSQASGRGVPLSQRYFAGGFHTLRGFPEESVGPADEAGYSVGGKVRVLGSLEARFSLYRRITAAVYLDAGQVVDSIDRVAMSGLSVGAGAGLRLRSPVGRMRADIAFPLTSGFADGPQLYIGTGGAF